MHGIRKEKAHKIFEQNEVYTDAFSLLGEFEVVPPNVIDLLEQFVCHLYKTKISMKSGNLWYTGSSADPKRKSTLKHFRQQKINFSYT